VSVVPVVAVGAVWAVVAVWAVWAVWPVVAVWVVGAVWAVVFIRYQAAHPLLHIVQISQASATLISAVEAKETLAKAQNLATPVDTIVTRSKRLERPKSLLLPSS
jgi:hypothetical protein